MSERRSFTRLQRIDVLHANGGLCHHCGEIINTAREKFEIEHVLPIALGGADDFTNTKPIHLHCHRKKTRDDIRKIAKAKRVKAKFEGGFRPAKHPLPCGRGSPVKKKLNGQVVRRDTNEPFGDGKR
jgi:5-methylcytosine-specific restriction endonuclease McrA